MRWAQGHGSHGGHADDIVVAVVKLREHLAAAGKLLDVSFFGEDFQEIQKIDVDSAAKAIVQNLTALLLAQIGRAKQP